MAFVLPACSLWKRELVRFVRDRHRLYGAILQPLLFWLLVGAGLNASFFPAGVDAQVTYLEYIYPGTLQEFSGAFGKPMPLIEPEAEEILLTYDWKGNVRELRNTLERIVLL